MNLNSASFGDLITMSDASVCLSFVFRHKKETYTRPSDLDTSHFSCHIRTTMTIRLTFRSQCNYILVTSYGDNTQQRGIVLATKQNQLTQLKMPLPYSNCNLDFHSLC